MLRFQRKLEYRISNTRRRYLFLYFSFHLYEPSFRLMDLVLYIHFLRQIYARVLSALAVILYLVTGRRHQFYIS